MSEPEKQEVDNTENQEQTENNGGNQRLSHAGNLLSPMVTVSLQNLLPTINRAVEQSVTAAVRDVVKHTRVQYYCV